MNGAAKTGQDHDGTETEAHAESPRTGGRATHASLLLTGGQRERELTRPAHRSIDPVLPGADDRARDR